MFDLISEYITLAIAILGCALSIYNFIENRSRKRYEKSCLIETRYLTIWVKNGMITSIKYRFCLTNISNRTISLRKIYFSHPAINHGKKIEIDQIGEVKILFHAGNLKIKRHSQRLPGSDEILPCLLKPGTKYEGFTTIDIKEINPESLSPLDINPPNEMEIVLLFSKPQKQIVPVEYKKADMAPPNQL